MMVHDSQEKKSSFLDLSSIYFLINKDVSAAGSGSVFRQSSSDRTAVSKGSTKLGASLPEGGSRAGLHNIVPC